jgi:glycosyltransferase involved in cell wall biosynthesis
MPPDKTGIATYSRQLALALNEACELTVFTQTRQAAPVPGITVREFIDDPYVLKELARYDHAVYHIGNNPWFHAQIWRAALAFPATVCLHDTVLYYLAAGLGRGRLLQELMIADGGRAFAEVAAIEREAPEGDLLRYSTPSRHACVRTLLEATPHVMVHNRSSAEGLREMGYKGRVSVIPILHYADAFPAPPPSEVRALRARLGLAEASLVIGAFGFIGPTKRMDSLFEALARLRRGGLDARLLVVGVGDPIEERVAALGMQDVVTHLGFVSDEEFRASLAGVDVVANLRYPSHGESSASLVQAMSYGKACIVTNHGSFSEMPDSVVAKIGHGETEVEELAVALERMASGPAREELGLAARRHVEKFHAPDAVAAVVLEHLQATPKPSWSIGRPAAFDARAYLARRAEELCPS